MRMKYQPANQLTASIVQFSLHKDAWVQEAVKKIDPVQELNSLNTNSSLIVTEFAEI